MQENADLKELTDNSIDGDFSTHLLVTGKTPSKRKKNGKTLLINQNSAPTTAQYTFFSSEYRQCAGP